MVRLIKGENDLATLNPALAKEWHPTENGNLKPEDVTPGSGKEVWWLCPEGHPYLMEVNQRAKFHYWLFGHYHDNKNVTDRHVLLWEQIVRVL